MQEFRCEQEDMENKIFVTRAEVIVNVAISHFDSRTDTKMHSGDECAIPYPG